METNIVSTRWSSLFVHMGVIKR